MQKSRVMWLKEGDVNTGFFHACIKSKRRMNVILALKVENGWIEVVYEIIQVTVDHFSNQFREFYADRPQLDGIYSRSISEEDKANLTVYFLLFEIDQAVSLCDGNKNPGPDGFNLSFSIGFDSFSDMTFV